MRWMRMRLKSAEVGKDGSSHLVRAAWRRRAKRAKLKTVYEFPYDEKYSVLWSVMEFSIALETQAWPLR